MRYLTALALSVSLGAAIGYAISPDAWGLGIGAAIMFYIAKDVCQPDGEMLREEENILQTLTDTMTICNWMMGPAMETRDRIGGVALDQEDRIRFYSEAILHRFGKVEHTLPFHYRFHLNELLEVSRNSRATPVAALRRHNRKHKPGIFKKETMTSAILEMASICMVDAGLDARGARWYFHCTRLLKVSDHDAFIAVAVAYEMQKENPTAQTEHVRYYHEDIGNPEKREHTPLELTGDTYEPRNRKQLAYIEKIGEFRNEYNKLNPKIWN